MLSFTLFRCKMNVYFSFFALTSLFLLLDDTTYLFYCLAACIIHETAHICAMIGLDVKLQSISLSCRGMSIVPYNVNRYSVFYELLISASGCITNLVCAMLYFIDTTDIRLKLFAVMNLVVGMLNLLPVTGMDGASILKIIMKGKKTKAQPIINITAAMLIGIATAKLIYSRANITIILFIAIAFLSAAETVTSQKRSQD